VTVQPKFAMCAVVAKLVWGLALSCCKRKVVCFSGVTREMRAFSLASVVLFIFVITGSHNFNKKRKRRKKRKRSCSGDRRK
jgi:hypothetical protein